MKAMTIVASVCVAVVIISGAHMTYEAPNDFAEKYMREAVANRYPEAMFRAADFSGFVLENVREKRYWLPLGEVSQLTADVVPVAQTGFVGKLQSPATVTVSRMRDKNGVYRPVSLDGAEVFRFKGMERLLPVADRI